MARLRRWSLAGQFLAFQLAIMVVVLTAVAAISLNQSLKRFETVEGRRLQSVAENLAANSTVRLGLKQLLITPLAGTAEGTRNVTGLSFVVITDEHGTILTSPDPDDIGHTLPMGASTGLQGRSWIGGNQPEPWEPQEYEPTLISHVPVLSDSGDIVGLVAVGRGYPHTWEHFGLAAPYLLTYLGVAGILGALGSLLLASRIKRQTLGLEPQQIAATVEQREAMLHGVKEGVLGLDLADRVTLANEQAKQLLGLPQDCLDRALADLDLETDLLEVLAGRSEGDEQIVLVNERVLTLNRRPITSRGTRIGSVTTLRDRTELIELRRELDVTRHTTNALRAQAHEFSNQMHTIGGLIALEEYAEVTRYITRTARAHERLSSQVTDRIADPSLAALLIAKSSAAAERGARLDISQDSELPDVDAELSGDLVTIAGNLIDNALDALRPHGGGVVTVGVTVRPGAAEDDVVIAVGDTGPGVDADLAEDIFRQGFSTKDGGGGDPRGLGLAIIRLICRRRGGAVTLHDAVPRGGGGSGADGGGGVGALFVARLPFVDLDRSQPFTAESGVIC